MNKKRNLPLTSCRSVSHTEEGNNQLCLDSLLYLYQCYFRHIRIKEPPSNPYFPPPLPKKNDSAKIQLLFLYAK